MAPTNSFSVDSILEFIAHSLPENSTRPVKNPYSAIALISHACMLAAGFNLVGLGEDHKIETESQPSDVQRLPTEWDATTSYAFRYQHKSSSMEYVVKVTRLGSKAIVHGLGLGDDRTASFEIVAKDYTSEGSINEIVSKEDLKSKLKNVYISSGRITDLTSLFRSEIINKLAPGLQKEGYEQSNTREQPVRPEAAPERQPRRDDEPQPARPHPYDDPLAIPPRRPGPVPDFEPPGFEDDYEMLRQPRGMFPGGSEPFGRIGERDLYPQGMGPRDPFGMGGSGVGGRGGMHPTFDELTGRQGGGQFDPRAPPGARYDPPFPGQGPPSGRGSSFPGRFGGGPPNPFGGFGSGDFI